MHHLFSLRLHGAGSRDVKGVCFIFFSFTLKHFGLHFYMYKRCYINKVDLILILINKVGCALVVEPGVAGRASWLPCVTLAAKDFLPHPP